MDRTGNPHERANRDASDERTDTPGEEDQRAPRGFVIDEDWAATIVGLGLLLLALLGIIGKGMVP